MSRHHGAMNSRRWAVLRRRTLARDNWRCRTCGRPGRLEVDHVVPIEQGGDMWAESNLQTLCRGCHIQKTADERGHPVVTGRAEWLAKLDELTEEQRNVRLEP